MTQIQVIDGVAYRLVKSTGAPMGRPVEEIPPSKLEFLLFQRMTMTVKEMANFHEVSMSTINRWMRKARAYETTKEEKSKQ